MVGFYACVCCLVVTFGSCLVFGKIGFVLVVMWVLYIAGLWFDYCCLLLLVLLIYLLFVCLLGCLFLLLGLLLIVLIVLL